jgi:phenylalanyl-tRNA synthetase beta chain
MRFSERWLREWADPPVASEQLLEQLTLAGLEVDAVEPVAPPLAGVIVGRILAVQPHPRADRLRVCEVEVGRGSPLTIVCGAPNARPGLSAPVVLPGASLPNGTRIEAREVRGVQSYGMLCSGQELGLEERSEGLLELLDGDPGADLVALLALDDRSIEVDLTPNRADCLSVAGVAREVAVINRIPLAGPQIPEVPATLDRVFAVQCQSPADCPRYVGRVVSGVDGSAQTPLWMRERLRRSGVRSLGPLVDVTNYVMLELGQPMHAFDLATLQDHIEVRRARAGERLVLLDGQELALRDDTLVIADGQGAQAMAGIMGGQATAVSAATRELFLESAFFHPLAMAGRARSYGLNTESSRRFERGVDPELTRRAMERATALLLEIVGGQAGPLVEFSSSEHLPSRSPILLRQARISRVLGVDVPPEEVRDILDRLGLALEGRAGGWEARPPSFRFDLANEADLIEELARIRGYGRIPGTREPARIEMPQRPEARVARERIATLLADRGYFEAITYSFVDTELQAMLDPGHSPLALTNPLASDLAVLRTSLWVGLASALLRNTRRQQSRVRLFETGVVFHPQDNGVVAEFERIGAIATGAALPEQWGVPPRPVDFFDVKGDVEAILALSGCACDFRFSPEPHPALHPGQSARVWRGETAVGWVGALHPQLVRRTELAGTPYVFELDLAPFERGCLPRFRELSKFPGIRRDLAFIVDRQVSADRLRRSIVRAAGEVLRELVLFDLYQGSEMGDDKKSVALGLTLQDLSRTLTDQEVDAIMDSVIKNLHDEVGAKLRGEAWR